MVLAVAAAAAANLLAAPEKNGSAETFSHINATARADLCRAGRGVRAKQGQTGVPLGVQSEARDTA